ncbi:MAG: zinc-dependent metalloprotease [Longimicrobiales bacterium]
MGPTGTQARALPSIAEKTRGLEQRAGFVPMYWDASTGKLYLELSRFGRDQELLYVHALTAGVGSNDIGLDRGQLGGERIVYFERVGPRVLMVQPNYGYRALSDNEMERRAVEDAFARSVIFGFAVEAETAGRVLVDATEFAQRDAHDVVGRLRATEQGQFRLDRDRSALYLPGTKAFPKNTEIEVTLTFAGENPGGWLRSVTPMPQAVTVRQRHSLVELPEPGYEMRASSPAAGFFGITFMDYATPIDSPIVKRYIARHRLAKRDPAAPISEPVEPIVYYLDPGVPEPVRSALLDGARWWDQAFEAAGYRNAFRVELLPDTADMLDVRYNVIQWIHRSTRGWSYGSSVIDPRTGEIIKGHVSLGSLRVRQDLLIAEGLLAPYARGDERPAAAIEMALARIRQLSAHEVGHTLGLAHNYIASTQTRASVMDYPHPLVRLTADGHLDLSQAYDDAIGEWDKVAIRYGYQDFPSGTDEQAALETIIVDARSRGITFLSDQDARPPGSAHPQAHLWDNALDAAAELERIGRVRRVALDRFGLEVIRSGQPLATLEEALVPLYLHHRYQVEAAVKLVGGQFYTYALRGDDQEPVRSVNALAQEQALEAVLATVRPEYLALPQRVLRLIPPRPFTFAPHRELFDRFTGLTFDAISPAVAAADLSISLLLNPQRAARLVEQQALDPALPGLGRLLERLIAVTFDAPSPTGYHREIQRAIERVVIDELMALAAGADMPQVRAEASYALEQLRRRFTELPAAAAEAERAHAFLMANDIARFMEDPDEFRRAELPSAPPGAPIGADRIGVVCTW